MSNEIDRNLIGLSVKGKNTDFGQITELVEVKHDNEFVIIAIITVVTWYFPSLIKNFPFNILKIFVIYNNKFFNNNTIISKFYINF